MQITVDVPEETCGKPSPSCCGCVALNSPDCPRMQTANTTSANLSKPNMADRRTED